MALYVVLHHKSDAQSWTNAWHDDQQRIVAIQTTKEIGELCRKAMERRERVLVHRCGYGGFEPVVCCSAEVNRVDSIDKNTDLVTFGNATLLAKPPPVTPVKGQNFYIV